MQKAELMPEIFILKIKDIQPSQLYISSTKLANIYVKFNFITTGAITPVPVKKLGEDIIYTDGHTRAFALYERGENEIRAYWDEDDLDLGEYEICVGWCKDEGIFTIADLKDRVVSPDDFQKLWIRRCQMMQNELKAGRDTE